MKSAVNPEANEKCIKKMNKNIVRLYDYNSLFAYNRAILKRNDWTVEIWDSLKLQTHCLLQKCNYAKCNQVATCGNSCIFNVIKQKINSESSVSNMAASKKSIFLKISVCVKTICPK